MEITTCDDSVSLPLTISNPGDDDLTFDISFGSGTAILQNNIEVAVYNSSSVAGVLNSQTDINATAVSYYDAASLANYDVLMNIRNGDLNQADVLDFISNGGTWIGEWSSNEIPVSTWGAISGSISGSATGGSQSANIIDADHYLAENIDWASLPYGANPCDYMRDLRGISDPDANIIVTVNHTSYPNNPLLVEKRYGKGKIILFNWDYNDS
ncbi:MAG: hypothetical protein MI749_21430, partial [Desulfovibrionales bacterium]|nr:hypothetical protein [Desulfovibrionales bacterium]